MSIRNKLKLIPGAWKFLIGIIFLYSFLFLFWQSLFFPSLIFSYEIILKILPVFFLIFALMAVSNYFVTSELVARHLSGGGIKKWVLVVIGGILSSGPIYMWYPLLADLKKKGLSHGLIACFLYNRAIKIPLLPIAVFYFGWAYVLILSIVMIFMSIIQGLMINKLIKLKL